MAEGDPHRARLQLVGPFLLLDRRGTAVRITSKKSKALIALLALAPNGSHARGWLQTMLWGSRFREQAQSSLRREIATLNRALEEAGLEHLLGRSGAAISLDLDSIDVDALALGAGLEVERTMVGVGEFLEGLWLPDCEEFTDWLVKQRALVDEIRQVRFPATQSTVDAESGQQAGSTVPQGDADSSLPPKPSVCVLPLRRLGATVEAFIGPAVSEELNVTLARLPSLFVVASGSGAVLAARGLEHVAIAECLGVRYLIDGTVQQDADKLRVGVSLIDGTTGCQLWAQTFDGRREDLFGLQERIAAAVAPQIHTQIDIRELRGALVNPLRSGDAYALYWRANALFRQWDRESITEAIEVCEALVAMAPVSGWAASLSAFCHSIAYALGWSTTPGQARRIAIRHYQSALRYGGEDPIVLGYAAGTLICIGGDLEVADRLIAHALRMLPSYQPTLFWGGWVDIARGDARRARDRFELSLRINPMAGARAYAETGIGLAQLMQGEFQEAFELLRGASEYIPDYPLTLVGLCVAALMIGETDISRRAALEVVKRPDDLARVLAALRGPMHRELLEEGLRRALAEGKAI